MRTNSDAEREMWEYAREMRAMEPEKEMTVTRYWFPVPMNVSWKAIIENCPAGLEARVEKTEGDDRLVIRRKK